jgi:hypothetical protein
LKDIVPVDFFDKGDTKDAVPDVLVTAKLVWLTFPLHVPETFAPDMSCPDAFLTVTAAVTFQLPLR